eukprot:TRINITY_DN75416_c0_g1_i1.p1 TRINITY_DN75416_c0_g1~~TRINITY_DN75416_c0_g1_i1.p1  ORF type:complete len:121 (+),score=27.44 TRINITY_DN75416_c0_g1_i1:85-447(+)
MDDDNDKHTRMQHWAGSFCMCWEDCGGCLVVTCCYPYGLAKAKSTFDRTSFCLNMLFAACSPCFAAVVFRNEVRIGYGISGYWWEDALQGCLCPCCSACQLSREVSRRGAVVTEPMVALM